MNDSSSAVIIPFEPKRRRARDRPDLRRVSRGVYVPALSPETLTERTLAVARVVRPGNVVVDRTAAWLHGIDAYAWGEHEIPLPIEFCAPPGVTRVARLGVQGRNRTLHPSDVMDLDGVAITTPTRTALDLGCVLHRREAMAALDAFARLHGVSTRDLEIGLIRYRRRRGVVQLRELVSYVDARAESPRESWMRLALIDAGLPRPEPQVVVETPGGATYRIDLAYRLARVAVEYDGAEHHSGVLDRVRDERRRRDLALMGWTTVVIREGDFQPDRLAYWTAQVREALTSSYTSRRW